MAATASDPTLWVDDDGESPPVAWQALEEDGRWWLSSSLDEPHRTITFTGMKDQFPELIEILAQITESPNASYVRLQVQWEVRSADNEYYDGDYLLDDNSSGAYLLEIDPSEWPDDQELTFKLMFSNSHGWGDYGGVMALLGPGGFTGEDEEPEEPEEPEDDCDVCFDVGHLCQSPISELVPDVLEHVPKVSEPQVESVLRDTLIDFLKRTKLLHFDHPAISVVADQATYTLQNPCGFQILHVRSGTIDGHPLLQTSEEYLDLQWQELQRGFGWRYQISEPRPAQPVDDWRLAVSELPGLFYQLYPNQLTLVGKPTVAIADALRLKVVVIPTRAVENIPRWIFNTWHQGIVAGAIGGLKMMPEKPWTDRQAAGAYIEAYNEAIGAAEATALRGFKRNDQPVIRTKAW
jgi:hypothetical protein